MSKRAEQVLLPDLSPCLAEAALGEFAACVTVGRRHPIATGRQVMQLLEHGAKVLYDKDFIEDPIVTPEVAMEYLEGLEPYIEQRLNTPDGVAELQAKAKAIRRYRKKFATVAATATAGEVSYRTGGFSDVHPFRLDGYKYMARRIYKASWRSTPLQEVDKHFTASWLSRGVDGMEHVRAISYAQGVTVAPFIGGEQFRTMVKPAELQGVSSQQMQELYHNMKQAEACGVGFDTEGKNLLYDRRDGFHWVDLGPLWQDAIYKPAELSLGDEIIRIKDSDISHELAPELGRLTGAVIEAMHDHPDAAYQEYMSTVLHAVTQRLDK